MTGDISSKVDRFQSDWRDSHREVWHLRNERDYHQEVSTNRPEAGQ